jgi:PKD repeat protein
MAIDFDGNGVFDNSERTGGYINMSGIWWNYDYWSFNLDNRGLDSVPLRMRVRATCSISDPFCGPFTGNYKDVTVYLIPHALTPANFDASQKSVCGVDSAYIGFSNNTKGVKYSYWDFGDGDTSTQFSPLHLYANPGTYTVKLKTCNDTKCDSITKTNYVTISPIPFAASTNTPDTVYLCGSNPILISTKYLSGHTYQWHQAGSPLSIPSATDTSYNITTPGLYNVLVTNPVGCEYRTPYVLVNNAYTGCIWPGDVNNDLVVDQNDLLPIGVLHGVAGYARPKKGNLWYGYPSFDWQLSSPLLSNDKFADCNGDGIISMQDTLAVYQNFNSTHLNKISALPFQSSINPDVSVKFNKIMYQNGDTVIADVHIGSAFNPQNNFYGASFKLNYDPSYAVPGTVKFTFNDSWIGKLNKRFIKFSKIRESLGLIDLSIVRISQTDTSGYGKIGTLKFVVSNTMPNGKMIFNIMNANKIDHFGINFTPLAGGSDSVNVVQTSSLERTSSINHIIIRPNPSNGKFEINSSSLLNRVCIYNLLGETIYREYFNSSFELIDISNRPQGVYILNVNGSYYKIIKE